MSGTQTDPNFDPPYHLLQVFAHRPDSFNTVAWSPDAKFLASGSDDGTVRLWDAASGKLLRTLEGRSDYVRSVAWSPDAKFLASGSEDNTVRLWDAKNWRVAQTCETFRPQHNLLATGFIPRRPVPAILGRTCLDDPDIIISPVELTSRPPGPVQETVSIASAKIVLVGESNVGKSCLALRLAQDRYEEQGTTHGMRLWRLDPTKLGASPSAGNGDKREVILWDLGLCREVKE